MHTSCKKQKNKTLINVIARDTRKLNCTIEQYVNKTKIKTRKCLALRTKKKKKPRHLREISPLRLRRCLIDLVTNKKKTGQLNLRVTESYYSCI